MNWIEAVEVGRLAIRSAGLQNLQASDSTHTSYPIRRTYSIISGIARLFHPGPSFLIGFDNGEVALESVEGRDGGIIVTRTTGGTICHSMQCVPSRTDFCKYAMAP